MLIKVRDFQMWPHAPLWEKHLDPSLLLLPASSLDSFFINMLCPTPSQPLSHFSEFISPPISTASTAQFITNTIGSATSIKIIKIPFNSSAIEYQANPTQINQTEDWTHQQIKLAQAAKGPVTLSQLEAKVYFIAVV